jgi:hypothetical protein
MNPMTSKASDHQIEQEIKDWLKFASERDGGRKQRDVTKRGSGKAPRSTGGSSASNKPWRQSSAERLRHQESVQRRRYSVSRLLDSSAEKLPHRNRSAEQTPRRDRSMEQTPRRNRSAEQTPRRNRSAEQTPRRDRSASP